jgi:hypothetical protein
MPRMDDEQLAARNVQGGYECAGLLRIDGRDRIEAEPIKQGDEAMRSVR